VKRSSVGGQPSELAGAIAAAAELLRAAKQPLVYGLAESTVEAQRAAVRLAQRLGAIVDTPASISHAGSLRAFERLGAQSATRGELRRADLTVFWACDPDASLAPSNPDRVSVDVGVARGPKDAAARVLLEPDQEVPALLALRAFVRGRRVEAAAGLPLESLRALAGRLTRCRYGLVVADADPIAARRDAEVPDALAALVRECHGKARVRLVGLRRGGNPVGAESVLTWLTGFPTSVRFAAGGPCYGPGEFSVEALLQRGDVDAVLLVGVEPEAQLASGSAARLARLPCVALGPVAREGARVFIATAPLTATGGRVFRGDGVALRQIPRESSELPSESVILERLAAALP
jgi:formylmethanofuran dehydrogenase subunit B